VSKSHAKSAQHQHTRTNFTISREKNIYEQTAHIYAWTAQAKTSKVKNDQSLKKEDESVT
jgi:hypothetical protein